MGFNPFDTFGLFSGDESDAQAPALPTYTEDPNYRQTQDFLQPYGENILNGNIPDYYKSIGEPNSQQFQDYLNLSNRDISQGAAEAAAKSGRGRGGSLASVTAQAIGDNSAKLRYTDFLNSQNGKQFLLQQGRGITEGVRGAGQTEGANVNNFNLKNYDNAYKAYQDEVAADNANSAAMGKAVGTVVGGVGGFMLGGPAGAAVGANLGSSIAGGGNPSANANMMDIFNSKNSPTTGVNNASGVPGVSNIGAINPSDYLLKNSPYLTGGY